ncbi:MAG: hypothetical protein MUC97_15835 [Bernardetiaceae bacterium]|jgi:hypothetical protein|nr:hypothetical protein [Bernardetiaceae bacterium]
MKRTQRVLLLAACWLALGFGCGREPQPCTEEVGDIIPLKEDLTLLLRTWCDIRNRESPRDLTGLPLPVTEYIINSQAELERWVDCSDATIPTSIDFSRYTLIAGQKLTTRSFAEQSLHWRCNVILYQLKYNSFGSHSIGLVSYFALVSKLPFKPTIVYEIVH